MIIKNKDFFGLCKGLLIAQCVVLIFSCKPSISENSTPTPKSTPKVQVSGRSALIAAFSGLSEELNTDKTVTDSAKLQRNLLQLATLLETHKDVLVEQAGDKTQFAAGLMMLALGAAQHDKDATVVGLGYAVAALLDHAELDNHIRNIIYTDGKKDTSETLTANPLKQSAAFKNALESLDSDNSSSNALKKAILKAVKITVQRALARSGDSGEIMAGKDADKTSTLALAGKVATAERTRIAKALVEVAKAALIADTSPDEADLKQLAEHHSLGTVMINMNRELGSVNKEHAKMEAALTALKNVLRAPDGADDNGALVSALSKALKDVVAGEHLQTAMTLALVALKVTDADTSKLQTDMNRAGAASRRVDKNNPTKESLLSAMTEVSAALGTFAILLTDAMTKILTASVK